MTLALAELISDSPSELASVIGHEFGHIYQVRNGHESTWLFGLGTIPMELRVL